MWLQVGYFATQPKIIRKIRNVSAIMATGPLEGMALWPPWIRHCEGHMLGKHQGHLSVWEDNWGGAAGGQARARGELLPPLC